MSDRKTQTIEYGTENLVSKEETEMARVQKNASFNSEELIEKEEATMSESKAQTIEYGTVNLDSREVSKMGKTQKGTVNNGKQHANEAVMPEGTREASFIEVDAESLVMVEGSDEQQLAVICATVDSNLLEGVNNRDEFEETPAYAALMDALGQYEDAPQEDEWLGESEDDPTIVAVLERCEPDYDDEDLEEDGELETVYFTAVVHGDLR